MIDLVLAVNTADPDDLAMKLAVRIDLSFSARESSYWGPYLNCPLAGGGKLEVHLNADPMYEEGDPDDQRYFVAEHPDCAVLIRATLTASQESELTGCLVAMGLTYHQVSREDG